MTGTSNLYCRWPECKVRDIEKQSYKGKKTQHWRRTWFRAVFIDVKVKNKHKFGNFSFLPLPSPKTPPPISFPPAKTTLRS